MQSAQPTPVDVFLRTHPDRGGLCVQVASGGGPARAHSRRRASYTSVTVPAVDRGFCEVVFWSMEMAGERPSI